MTIDFTYDYNSGYQPPMPVVTIRVGPALSTTLLEPPAIIDSGADATSLPLTYLRQIGARRNRKAWLRGVTGERPLVDLYAITFELGPLRQGLLEVVADPIGDDVLVGRDVLNDLEVTLNGPAHAVLIRAQ